MRERERERARCGYIDLGGGRGGKRGNACRIWTCRRHTGADQREGGKDAGLGGSASSYVIEIID